ncbi:S41 family peptidase [Hoylesella oralis]|uniref:S41 family peptidase n=1 Tax=Hoylesella oralis TaxID=28134 RepID=UPI0028ED1B9A|nr:S41 family peptidase [Hoylesella oralis]
MKRLALYLLLIISLPSMAQTEREHNFDVAKNMNVFNTIYKNLDLMYVDTLNANEVIGNGINAMLRSLDPYTEYYPEDKVKTLKSMITGRYAGIGSIIRYNHHNKQVIIEEPYANMPAAEAGLKKGDIILAIDDSSMMNKSTSYVSQRLMGDAGSTFLLKIKRPSTGKVMKIKITRKAIQLPAVPYYGMQAGNIGYINLSSFTEDCSKNVRRAFIDLKKQGAKGLILDLRGNGGGSVSEAANVINMFVPKGLSLVKTVGKLKRANSEYKTTVEPIDTIMPMVVLVDGGTASSSEITSGSLQDLDRAIILGTRTYGKGLVQLTMDLPYNGSMKLTTGKYYIPSGRCIQAINYKHARGGYTEHVPDSLTKEFHTANGRIVRDGGGIMPDVEVKPDTMSNIAVYLSNSDGYGVAVDSTESMLEYEINYIAKHPTLQDPAGFQISDEDFEDFKKCVIKNGFTYDRESEKYLKNLVKLAKFEGYYEDTKADFDNLEKKLSHNLSRDLDHNKKELKEIISKDIVTAYHFQSGAIQNTLLRDKQMKEALRLLNNPAEYRKILQPKK